MNDSIRPKALLFDWDNTLVESWSTIHRAWNATLNDFGLASVDLKKVQETVRLSARESFPKYFGDQSEQAIALYRKHYAQFHSTPEPLSSALNLLLFCQENKLSCGVISNKSHDFLQQEIAELDWAQFFPLGAMGAGKATADKPDPAVLYALVPDIIPSSAYWYIGDTGVDCQFAYNTDMYAVLIGDNIQANDPKPHLQCQNLSDLLQKLEPYI